MQITKPSHNRYVLSYLYNTTYVKHVNAYSDCKLWGVQGIYIFLGGTRLDSGM